MPKKVTKEIKIGSKKQGYWVNNENLHKNEKAPLLFKPFK